MKTIIISSIISISLLSAAFLMAGDTGIDKSFLTRNSFKYGTVISSSELIFMPEGKYTYEYGSEGVNWYNRGTYSIRNDAVHLNPDFCSTHKDGSANNCAETMGEALCSIQTRPDDLYYYKYFICTSKRNKNAVSMNNASMPFPVENSKIKAGTGKIFKGIPVVTMGLVKGLTTANVKIREKPSINSKSLDYIKALYETDSVLQSVPAATEITIIARTRDRDTVQTWNNYWYLVSIGFTSEVWMYGEFVKIK